MWCAKMEFTDMEPLKFDVDGLARHPSLKTVAIDSEVSKA